MKLDTPWWFKLAKCIGRGHRAFVGARGGNVQLAKTVCSTCDVAEICLWYAISLEDPVNRAGVFGGASPADRQRLVDEHHITPDQAHGWYLSEQQVVLQRIQATNE